MITEDDIGALEMIQAYLAMEVIPVQFIVEGFLGTA